MAKYKAYPEYKDSGVEWLGEIPAHWNVKRIKENASVISGYPFSSSQFHPEKGFPLVRIRDINAKRTEVFFDGHVPNESKINTGDILIGMDGDFNVAWWNNGEAALNQRVACIRTATDIFTRFIFYIIPFNMKVVNDLTYFTTVKHLSNNDILKTFFALPCKDEVRSIVNFLDHETAKIDNLIEKQQQLIELLKEKRQAVISHAVTKGLNPDVPMKDSGVEWLGEVPEHWGITKLKWVGRTTSGGTPTTSKFEIYYEDGHIPWIRTTDLNNGELFDTPIRITSKAVNDTACSILPVGSVLLGMYGGAGSIGKHAILRFESTINQAVCGVLPCGRILPDFLHKYYEFYRPFWMIDAAGTRKDPNIGQDNIKEGIILIPPFEEQVEINNHIDNMRNIYECIIENALEGMDLLQERRTALISAAVTGKIDVRDWVAPDTQDVEEPQEVTA
ncbi:restriction endonuclease subunit S [Cronobacter dublinensis]|uniref:restriction endonuclease subunit S n=2 Tax=Cronobacter dublinensis TaxID=413497 RepID=UPI000CFCFFFD|nr:restriction endonuclease subunit S [Cronobacter dublinensis]